MSFSCRTASLSELETILDWAAAEGWNPGTADARSFYAADSTGFFVGVLDERVVSAISAVKYGVGFGFVGLYIVHPEFRGRGFGWATWRHALEPLAERNLGLDGVVAQQAAYARSGFVSAHRSVRYRSAERNPAGGGGGLPAIPSDATKAIQAFDRRFFPAERGAFLDAWLTQPGAETCYAERDGHIAAYGLMRPCREGWKIGPLFAENASAASGVLATLIARGAGRPVFIDVPQNNSAAMALVHGAGFTPVFETARMYTRGQPAGVDQAGVFGITSFELG